MDPQSFRRKLRHILANTAGATVLAGTMLGAGCSITIIQPPGEYVVGNDAGGNEQVVVDFDYTPYQPPGSCPLNDGKDVCQTPELQKVVKGVYHKILTSDVPSPLSKEECLKLCQTALDSWCPDNPGENVYYSRRALDCKDTVSEKRQRMVVCGYEIQQVCAVAGRRPAGLDTEQIVSAQPLSPMAEVGAFFAELSYLEHAAVTAFAYLVEELKAYRAPDTLIDIATAAIQEEREHVELMGALARRYGATPKVSTSAPFALRPLADIAIENAREGCVRESFGSLLGYWQAMTSEDPAVRATMERIAHEESNHGALSWAIDEWIRPQLRAEEIDAYQQAHAEAIEGIRSEIKDDPSEAMQRLAGFPTAAQAQHMFQQLV